MYEAGGNEVSNIIDLTSIIEYEKQEAAVNLRRDNIDYMCREVESSLADGVDTQAIVNYINSYMKILIK